ncbi:MAG: hypothetical protein V4739_04115 [Pseudomonadota bacterium]
MELPLALRTSPLIAGIALVCLRGFIAYWFPHLIFFAYVEYVGFRQEDGAIALVVGVVVYWIGVGAGALFFILGSVFQAAFQKKPFLRRLRVDCLLLSAFAVVIVLWGAVLIYQ